MDSVTRKSVVATTTTTTSTTTTPSTPAIRLTADEVLAEIHKAATAPGTSQLRSFAVLMRIQSYLPILVKLQGPHLSEMSEKLQLAVVLYILSKKTEGDLWISYSDIATALEEIAEEAPDDIKVVLYQWLKSDLGQLLNSGVETYNQDHPDQPVYVNITELMQTLPTDMHSVLCQSLPLQGEILLAATCRSFYAPYQKLSQQINEIKALFQPRVQGEIIKLETLLPKLSKYELDRYTLARICADKNVRASLKDAGFGNFTLQQLAEGHLTFGEAQKLRSFVKNYNEQQFPHEEELSNEEQSLSHEQQLLWIETELAKDEIFGKYFSPAYQCWPTLRARFNFERIMVGRTTGEFSVEHALLLGSPGVKKYLGDLISITAHCEKVTASWTSLQSSLSAFNDLVLQAYLDAKYISTRQFIQLNKGLQKYLEYPIIKKYFESGHIKSCKQLFELSGGQLRLLKQLNIKEYFDAGYITIDEYRELDAMRVGYLNSPVTKKHFDKKRITLNEFLKLTEINLHCIGSSVTEKYFDDGYLNTLSDLCDLPLFLREHLLPSPMVRTSFENEECTWDELVQLGNDIPYSGNDYWVELSWASIFSTYVETGWLKLHQLKNLTHQQMEDLTQPWVIEKIKSGALGVKAVLEQSWRFRWLRAQVETFGKSKVAKQL